jgi:hypothetical protein
LASQSESQPDLADSDVESSGDYAARQDPILAERLDAPSEPTVIYLEDASLLRPIATGDIFRGIVVPGSTSSESAHDLTMVVAHPSAMRKGAILEPQARAAPIMPVSGLRRSKWSGGHYDVFPLPLLAKVAARNGDGGVGNRAWGARVDLAAPAQTADLSVRRRVACLSPEGVLLLLQRLVHADTRFPVKIEHLRRTFLPKLDELDLLETWCDDLVDPDGDLEAQLASLALAFDQYLQVVDEATGMSIRDMLSSDTQAPIARRLIHAERRRRTASV